MEISKRTFIKGNTKIPFQFNELSHTANISKIKNHNTKCIVFACIHKYTDLKWSRMTKLTLQKLTIVLFIPLCCFKKYETTLTSQSLTLSW